MEWSCSLKVGGGVTPGFTSKYVTSTDILLMIIMCPRVLQYQSAFQSSNLTGWIRVKWRMYICAILYRQTLE